MLSTPILLDYQSSTPCSKDVVDSMKPFWSEIFSNPASKSNLAGINASAILEASREKIEQNLFLKNKKIIFIQKNRGFKGSVSLLITGDEEGVAINGTKKVVDYLKKRKEKIDFCLVGEPTNPNKLGEMIKIGRRGSMTGRLTITGIQGHVAYPHRANNPSTTIVKILNELKDIKFDKGTKDFQPTNLEITKINIHNMADNVIPGIAYATFNIRFNNKHTSNSIKNKIEKILKKVCNKTKSKYKIDYAVSGEAFLTKPNHTTFMIQKIIKEITKIKPKLSTTGGTSDARFIRKIAPCLEFGLVGKTMHKVDEAVSLTDLKKLSLIYLNILKHYFK